MPTNDQTDRLALEQLVADLEEYLAAEGRSARWLGFKVANDPRLIPNLKRGQSYPVPVMRDLYLRLLDFYKGLADAEDAGLLSEAA